MTIQPLGSNVLLKPDEPKPEETTKSGIILPSVVEKKDEIMEATVVAVGLGVEDVHPGQRVLAKKFLGDPITIDEQAFIMIAEEDIIAIVETVEEAV